MCSVDQGSWTSTLPELRRWASDNIELLSANMYFCSSTRLFLMDDLVTPTFDWWLIEPNFSCTSVLLKARSADTILGRTSSSGWLV